MCTCESFDIDNSLPLCEQAWMAGTLQCRAHYEAESTLFKCLVSWAVLLADESLGYFKHIWQALARS